MAVLAVLGPLASALLVAQFDSRFLACQGTFLRARDLRPMSHTAPSFVKESRYGQSAQKVQMAPRLRIWVVKEWRDGPKWASYGPLKWPLNGLSKALFCALDWPVLGAVWGPIKGQIEVICVSYGALIGVVGRRNQGFRASSRP